METTTDALVVGAGPTGLTLASELRHRGLTVRIVDRAEAPPAWSGAAAVHARTLEILQRMDVAADLVARGQKLHGATLWSAGETVARLDFAELDSAFPFLLSVAQTDTTAVLEALLQRLDAKVERGVALRSFRQDGSGVTAVLARGDATETVRAAWMVGCDGAQSTVRQGLDITFEGDVAEDNFVVAEAKIAWDSRDDRVAMYFTDEGLVACFPLPAGRWRLIFSASADDDGATPPALAELQAAFAKRTGSGSVLSDLTGSARLRVRCRQAAQYRDDRVFIVGDAAQVHSPVGAQGLNTGIQDAHNLAWKIAQVHRGLARGRLLDSFHDERHAVAQSVLRGTDAALKVGTHRLPATRAIRDQVARVLTSFEVIQHRVAREVAELSVGYERSGLVSEHSQGILQGRIGAAAGGETPTVASIRSFDRAVPAGHRGRDGRVTRAGESGTRALLEALDDRRWNLLLFDGRSASPEGYARFASIASAVRSRYGEAVDITVVTPRSARPTELPDTLAVLLDPDAELERAYGAETECAYLLRPDLYVGYRCQPADEARVLAYLRPILRVTSDAAVPAAQGDYLRSGSPGGGIDGGIESRS